MKDVTCNKTNSALDTKELTDYLYRQSLTGLLITAIVFGALVLFFAGTAPASVVNTLQPSF